MEEEIKYPIRFDQCPSCGSVIRVMEREVNRAIILGNLPPKIAIPALITESHIIDKRQPLVSAKKFPVLVCFYDVCANCGTLYCREVIKREGLAQPKPKILRGGLIPPRGLLPDISGN